MTSIESAYIDALLADASYIDLSIGFMTADSSYADLEKRLTPTLAAYIPTNFETISTINTSEVPFLGTGFYATVWRRCVDGNFSQAIGVI